MSFRISGLWAFVQVGPDDEEGVCAFHDGRGWMPMLAADEKRLGDIMPLAQDLASASGRPIKLVRFGTREEIQVIEPKPREGSS